MSPLFPRFASRRRHCFVRLVGLAALMMAAQLHARALVDIRASNELRVCVAGSSADFYTANALAFARYLGVSATVVRLARWDQQFENAAGVVDLPGRYVAQPLASGQCDLYPNDLHMLDWRRTKMDMVPYYTVRKMIVANQQLRSTVKQPADLAGLRAAVQKGTSYDDWLTAQNATSFRDKPVAIGYFPTAESMRRVSLGLADFTVTGSEGAFKWIRGDTLQNLDLLFPVGELEKVGWGIAPSADDLREALAGYFADSLRVGSELDRAWQKYYGISRMEYLFFEQSLDTRAAERAAIRAWALPAITGVIGLVLAMALWARRLRREVRRHRLTAERLAESRREVTRESARRLAVSEIQLSLELAPTLAEFGRILLLELSRRLPVRQALLCAAAGQGLRLVARYAGNAAPPDEALSTVPVAASLMDECLRERQPRLLDATAGSGLRIRSGLGEGEPAAVLIHPIVLGEQGIAVLELASMDPLGEDAQRLLRDLTPFVALSMLRLSAQPSA